jgi:hypothetical protein
MKTAFASRSRPAAAIEPIASHPGYAALVDERDRHLKSLRETEASLAAAKARLRVQSTGALSRLGNVAEMGKKLVAGGRVQFADPAELEAQADILTGAIAELEAKLRDLKGDLSLEVCRSLRAEHDQRLLEAHQAMVQMRGAIAGMFDLFDRIRAAGYDVSTVPSALPNPMPHQLLAAAMDPLGDLARFTERLKTDGIL